MPESANPPQNEALQGIREWLLLRIGGGFSLSVIGTLGLGSFSSNCRLTSDFVLEDLLNQLEVVLVDNREVLGDIDIGNIVAANVVQGFVHIALAELHHIAG